MLLFFINNVFKLKQSKFKKKSPIKTTLFIFIEKTKA